MRRSCRNIDITKPEVVFPWVLDCILRHKKRHDFRDLLHTVGGMSLAEYRRAIREHDDAAFEAPAMKIAEEACRRIAARLLDLPPVSMSYRRDGCSGKMRYIGKESAMQQVMDHIAVGSCEDIWRRRIVPQQASSIAGRGQVYGVKMIQKWKEEDNRAARWAAKHGRRYTKRYKFHGKGDVHSCYGSLKYEKFLALFRRDCGNETILWLWEQLLASHRVGGYGGVMIGALVSQWACQYMMSFAWRHVMNLHKVRRGRQIKLVSGCVMYMDDIILGGSNRGSMVKAIGSLTVYLREVLGMELKADWQIQDWAETPLDTMGYLIHDNGKVTVRPRIFLRARRVTARSVTGRIPVKRAERVLSYKGYFSHSDCRKVKKWMEDVWLRCAAVVSCASKRKTAPAPSGA